MPGDVRPQLRLSDVKLRLADEGDVSRMIAVELDAGQMFRTVGLDAIAEEEPDDPETLRAHLADGTAWVAERGGAVIGYAVASIVDRNAHLDQVSVIRAAQRIGVGRSLIAQVERWGQEQQLGSITLTTFADVPWNGPYYARLGYDALPNSELTPGLATLRVNEIANGIDLRPRIAMRKRLGSDNATT